MKFLDWCKQSKVLLAFYPPYSTHRLQPLDVGIFAPLASYYSQALDDLVRKSEGHTSISKRDFFSVFWPAFHEAFTKENIVSAWSNTGIWPFDPQKVLDSFPRPMKLRPGPSEARNARATVHRVYTIRRRRQEGSEVCSTSTRHVATTRRKRRWRG
jgi:hypothetical protein